MKASQRPHGHTEEDCKKAPGYRDCPVCTITDLNRKNAALLAALEKATKLLPPYQVCGEDRLEFALPSRLAEVPVDKKEIMREGFTCECGRKVKFTPYVYAHWDILLTHSCECGRRHEIQGGAVCLIARPSPRP